MEITSGSIPVQSFRQVFEFGEIVDFTPFTGYKADFESNKKLRQKLHFMIFKRTYDLND